jgi:ABC-2 type transport system permease protein
MTATTPVPEVSTRQMFSSFVAAEWIKLRTVRSTMYTLGLAAIVSIGIGAFACQRLVAQLAGAHNGAQRLDFTDGVDGVRRSLIGGVIAQLAIGALGVLVVTSEFGTGMIRATLGAMPQRRWWIAAKLAVFGAVALVVGQILTFTSFGIGQAILSTQHAGASLSDPGALRSVVATGVYIALIGMMGAAFGLIIKHTAGALSSVLGAVFVLPAIASAFSQPMQGHVMRFLPESIGEQASSTHQIFEAFGTWSGIGLMAGYVAVLLAIGCLLLERRDA